MKILPEICVEEKKKSPFLHFNTFLAFYVHVRLRTRAMSKTSMTVLPYSIVWFLDLALKNEKWNILSNWYMLWMRGIGGPCSYFCLLKCFICTEFLEASIEFCTWKHVTKSLNPIYLPHKKSCISHKRTGSHVCKQWPGVWNWEIH